MRENIIEGLIRQFESSCKMIREAIQNVPDERWHDGVKGWFYSNTAYHIVETMDFYSRSSPDGMKWGKKAGYIWSESIEIESEILPKITKKIVSEYLGEVESNLRNSLESIDIKSLGEQDGFEWFPSRFEKLLYLLRHSMHHCGELSKTLREWDCKRVSWT